MARKFINRQEKRGLDAKKDVSAEDEWANIGGDVKEADTKIETKIGASDAMDVLDRSITFGDKEETGPKTGLDLVKEEARNAMDAAGNTGQYIRFVNKHIQKQKEILFDTKTDKNYRHKIGAKLFLLSKSNDPSSTGNDLGLKFKNGKTTVSLYFSTENPDVLEKLNSIGRVDAASGKFVQLTLNLEDLHNLKSIPGLEQVTPVIPGIRNVETSYN